MRFEEILPALSAGKKIRRTKWKEDVCISIAIEGDCDHYVRYNFGSVFNFNKSDFESDDWEVVKETKKVKLRDLTEVQWEKWKIKCGTSRLCSSCPFSRINCSIDDTSNWFYHKDLYSDKFLDQEIEVEK